VVARRRAKLDAARLEQQIDLATIKNSAKKCCTKIVDAYKYGESAWMSVVNSFFFAIIRTHLTEPSSGNHPAASRTTTEQEPANTISMNAGC
jgi:hypothetical protein